MIQQLESNIPSAPKDSPAAKWIHFVMNFLWVVLVGVLIGEVLGTLAGMYWLNTAAADENTRQLYYAVKSAMPKGMLVCAVIALFIYFGVRIVSFFKVPKVKTGNDAFKEKFLILRRENRWIALENILRGFIAEKVSERPDFESADLVKVSHQLWDKVRLCNIKLLMFIIIPVLILVTFPLFSSLLFYTSANVLPKSAAFLAEHTKYVGEYAMSQVSIVQSLIMFLVNIVFFVFCSIITDKAVPQVKMKKAIESEKRVVSFVGMLFWFSFIILSSWHVQYFPFLPEAFIITFLFYATGLFHNEPARYDSVSGSEMPEKTTKWFVMPLLACLAGLFFQPDNWKSIVTVGTTLFVGAFMLIRHRGLYFLISVGRKVFIVTLTCFLLRNCAPYFLDDSYIKLDINVFLMLTACFSVIGINVVKLRQDEDIAVFGLNDYLGKIILILRHSNQLEVWVEKGMKIATYNQTQINAQQKSNIKRITNQNQQLSQRPPNLLPPQRK